MNIREITPNVSKIKTVCSYAYECVMPVSLPGSAIVASVLCVVALADTRVSLTHVYVYKTMNLEILSKDLLHNTFKRKANKKI